MDTQYNKSYYQENKDRIQARLRERRLDHKKRRKDHWSVVRWRARQKGHEFSIKPEDIDWVSHCPLLGIELNYFADKISDNSPSVDRIDSSKGYTKENTWVVSKKANTIKSDATLEELKLLVINLEKGIDIRAKSAYTKGIPL